MSAATAEDLWQDYLFLTRELAKFADAGDLPMVEELLGQREKLQAAISDNAGGQFLKSPAGLKLAAEIREKDARIKQRLLSTYNARKTQQTVNRAYEGGQPFPPLGGRLNQQG